MAYRKMKEWYVGDGYYKDGEKFAMDYYNSFVIQGMMVDMTAIMAEHRMIPVTEYEEALKRMIRFAELQERMISPEGTYPVIGRSLTYRIGAFQALGQVALMENYPKQSCQHKCDVPLPKSCTTNLRHKVLLTTRVGCNWDLPVINQRLPIPIPQQDHSISAP